jgi:hypothetical protein
MNPVAVRVRPSGLRIRELCADDADVMEAFIGDSRAAEMRAVGMPGYDRVTTKDVLDGAINGWIRAWVTERPDGRPVTLLMYAPTDVPGVWGGEGINAPDAVDLPGAATASMALSLDRLFADPAVRRLMGYVALSNPRSRRVLDKLGFTEEGVARRHLLLGGVQLSDAWIMALLREEWRGAAVFEAAMT